MASLSSRRVVFVLVQLGAAFGAATCGGEREPSATPALRALHAPSRASTGPSSSSSPLPRSPEPARRAPPDAPALFARLRPDLERCYALGKKATPEMTDGRLTLNASVAASGKPECVIPSEHTGLTQEVEDCMSARFAALELDEGAAWSVRVPVAIRDGAVQLGVPSPDSVVLESVETFRMPDAFDVLESLEPRLQACVAGVDGRSGVKSVLVGARVGADGRARCALATSRGALPTAVAECASSLLRAARFPPPKRGAGIVLVPIGLGG